jgi:hypothetical protein
VEAEISLIAELCPPLSIDIARQFSSQRFVPMFAPIFKSPDRAVSRAADDRDHQRGQRDWQFDQGRAWLIGCRDWPAAHRVGASDSTPNA